VKPLLAGEHFSVDGTLLQAWASHASLERIDGGTIHRYHPQGLARVVVLPRKVRDQGNVRAVHSFGEACG
jgi:hypothetical protein